MLEDKALRAAAERAVVPEIARRLGRLAAEPDEAFALAPDGEVLWRGEAAACWRTTARSRPACACWASSAPEPRAGARGQRLEAFVAAEAGRRLGPLASLEQAVADGRLKGLARGLAWRLIEAGGAIARADAAADVRALSQGERRALRSLGVRIAAFSLHLPALLRPEALAFATAFARAAEPDWTPAAPLARIGEPPPAIRALGLRGLIRAGGLAVSAASLMELETALRAGSTPAGASLSAAAREKLGWSEADAGYLMRALGFRPASRAPDGAALWRRGAHTDKERRAPLSPAFAGLAALKSVRPARGSRPSGRRARG